MSTERITFIMACDLALDLVTKQKEMAKLYERSLRCVGEGEVRARVLSLASDGVSKGLLKEDFFSNGENLVTFFAGLWIQYLLLEIAGIERTKLRALARKVFRDIEGEKSLH